MSVKVNILQSYILMVVFLMTDGQECSEKDRKLTNLLACTAIRNIECQEEFEDCMNNRVPKIRKHLTECEKSLKGTRQSRHRSVFQKLCREGNGGTNLRNDANKTLVCLCSKLSEDSLKKAHDRMNECIDEMRSKSCRSNAQQYNTRSTG